MSLLVLSASDVEQITSTLPTNDLVELMASTFSTLSSGTGAQSPHRLILQMRNHKTMFMPSRLEGVGTAIKVVSIPTSESALSTSRGIPGSTVVMDEETGYVKAFVNATSLTAQRNAAGSLLATQLLGPKEPRSLVAFGAGKQIEAHVDVFIRAYPSMKSVFIINRTENERFTKLLSTLQSRHGATVAISGVGSDSPGSQPRVHEHLLEADVICAATSAASPLFDTASIRAGAHINLVGSYTPKMMEVGADLIMRAGRVVVDSREACSLEAGELIQAKVPPGDLVEIGELASVGDTGHLVVDEEKCAEVRRAGDVTIFKSVGVGVQDTAIAALVVDRAQGLGVGTRIDSYN
ncbi:NAD(P)-binding protein, partial [Athelia psychrophila]